MDADKHFTHFGWLGRIQMPSMDEIIGRQPSSVPELSRFSAAACAGVARIGETAGFAVPIVQRPAVGEPPKRDRYALRLSCLRGRAAGTLQAARAYPILNSADREVQNRREQ
jgi:hypothetical protein